MKIGRHFVIHLAILLHLTVGNVEKTIFIAPAAINIPFQPPALNDLDLGFLTHSNRSTRAHVAATPPTDALRNGRATWLLLDDLRAGRRYEVRICWAATQPTTFKLDTFELNTVWETAELISSLAEFSASLPHPQTTRSSQAPTGNGKLEERQGEIQASALLLRILAAADYYADDVNIMLNANPIYVDIILDPFFLNALPESLMPTIGLLMMVAMMSWFVAQRTWLNLRQFSNSGLKYKREKKDK